MKFLDVVGVLTLITSVFVFKANAQLPDLQATFKQFLDSTRHRFECGFPFLQIPPLEPYFLSNYASTLNAVGGLSNVNLSVSNTSTFGLSKFDMKKLDMAPWESRVSFDINYPTLIFNGTHKTATDLNKEHLIGNGPYQVTAHNVSIAFTVIIDWFPAMKIKSQNVTKASVSSVDASFKGFRDTDTDHKVSENFSSGGPAWLGNNLKQVNQELERSLVAFSSNRLSNFMNLDHVFKEIMSFNASTHCGGA